MRTLNLGILAHVDAGKTTLTERLLYAAGVIDEIGSVDHGSTQTDSLALERQRGITIKSAVVSFVVGSGDDPVTINLIDTPGHPDFIAEVERVLSVLDGAVLVVSAVEGVQAQTRVLMRTLQRLRIPTLVFVNKVDRRGADDERVLREIAAKLTPAVVRMGSVAALGSRDAVATPYGPDDAGFRGRLGELLAEYDDELLAAFVDERPVPYRRLRRELTVQTRAASVHPVYSGSAFTGAGVDTLVDGITELLPAREGDTDGPVSGTVFKVERGPAGEKIAYVRMFSGTVHTRERLTLPRGGEGKVTAIGAFDNGSTVPGDSLVAGRIGKVWGLGDIRIGDAIGTPRAGAAEHHFGQPTLETVVEPARPADRGRLRVALDQLAEQDPLINLRQDDVRQELYVSLYGEVQKEVIQATLADEYDVEVSFRETTTICIERPTGTGAAYELIGADSNPFRATVGLRIEPAEVGSGVRFQLEVELGSMPYAFIRAVEETVRSTLQQGRHGWQVTDCVVTLTHSGYTPPPPYGWSKWSSSAGDFRKLTPLVLMTALRRAGTSVHEPVDRFRLEIPEDTLAVVWPALIGLGSLPQAPAIRDTSAILDGEIPAARVHELQQQLPGLTRGEAVLERAFAGYQPVRGPIPSRPRTDHNPFDRQEYLLHLSHRI
ncbi:MAG TPA: translation factor GTPase family protein [Kribbellaceae bacterium]|nr:translation factor GTPase family protein [Kribbellaceae bacterium]